MTLIDRTRHDVKIEKTELYERTGKDLRENKVMFQTLLQFQYKFNVSLICLNA